MQRWFDGDATAVAVSPDGSAVFATGDNDGGYATAGYDTTIGALRWASRYRASSPGAGQSVAVSPTGSAVFVTGTSTAATTGADYATIAYSN